MIVNISHQFEKDMLKNSSTNKNLQKKIVSFIQELIAISSLYEISNIKKMQGFTNYYRKRIGNFRIGFSLQEDSSILLERCLKRGEIYKKFP